MLTAEAAQDAMNEEQASEAEHWNTSPGILSSPVPFCQDRHVHFPLCVVGEDDFQGQHWLMAKLLSKAELAGCSRNCGDWGEGVEAVRPLLSLP